MTTAAVPGIAPGATGQDALDGLLVVEIASSFRVAYCGRLFADWGATVVKVERQGVADSQWQRAWLDRGKQSVLLDWETDEGAALLATLARKADVAVRDRASEGPDLGTLPESVVDTWLSDFGPDGPWADRPATDLTLSALSGMATSNNLAHRVPLREPGNQVDILTALAGFIGTLAALEFRHDGDLGQRVDISALEAMVNLLSPSVLQNSYQHGGPPRLPSRRGFMFDCSDGQVSVIVLPQRTWDFLVSLWNLPVDPGDPRFLTEPDRLAHYDEVRAILAPVIRKMTRRELFDQLAVIRIACGMLLSPDELRHDPHLSARGTFLPPRPSGATYPAPAIRVAGIPPHADAPSPEAGEHTALYASAESVPI